MKQSQGASVRFNKDGSNLKSVTKSRQAPSAGLTYINTHEMLLDEEPAIVSPLNRASSRECDFRSNGKKSMKKSSTK